MIRLRVRGGSLRSLEARRMQSPRTKEPKQNTRNIHEQTMKMKHPSTRSSACLLAAVLIAWGAAGTAFAADPPLQPKIVPRPLTPGDKTVYGLPSTMDVSGGLTTVGVGTSVYLEMEVTNTFPSTNILSVSWALTNVPSLSTATLSDSPLGSNVPVYEPADRLVYKVASRSFFKPDVRGQYTVIGTVVTKSGTTNLTKVFTAGTYMGVQTCTLCHSGGLLAPEKVQPWSTTAHATIFSHGIDGDLGSYSKSCLPCHTVGYNLSTNAVNGGFDDVAAQVGWIFPTVLASTNFASMPRALTNLANIQCENCHGPGSEHAYSLGNTNFISITVNSGDCNQCHDAPTHHVKGTEWYASRHAVTTRTPTGPGRETCVACHATDGFIARINGSTAPTNTTFSAIACLTCHEPHGQTAPTNNPHLIRAMTPVTMGDGTVISSAGEGLLCLQCHHSRNGSAVTNVVNYIAGLPTWLGGSSFGPHDGPQGDLVLGVNAITYGKDIPSSAHRSAVTNLCVTCHMQPTAITDPGFLIAGGHTFGMSATNKLGAEIQLTAACAQCHGKIDSFDLVREDYDGNGVIEGVQEEVKGLLNNLSTYLPNAAGVVDGTVKASLSVKKTWTKAQLNAAYNWQYINNDGSMGVHNVPYAVGILRASIADLSGASANNAALAAWQVQYFGSTSAANAALNASPAGDGIPNWLKFALGLNPLIPGLSVTNGVVLADVTAIGGTPNTVHIYNAAEVAFDTVVGSTYQIQGISSLGGVWQNIGTPIAGTGNSINYLTSTRKGVYQFYRVVHTP